MRILIQRVQEGSVSIQDKTISHIDQGLVVLLGIEDSDDEKDIDYLVKKLINCRIFDDKDGIMNRSLFDLDGELLVVSQFTLQAITAKGNRPSYIKASKGDVARPLYEKFCSEASRLLGKKVATGQFGADMKVNIINDGPVTIWMDSKQKKY